MTLGEPMYLTYDPRSTIKGCICKKMTCIYTLVLCLSLYGQRQAGMVLAYYIFFGSKINNLSVV